MYAVDSRSDAKIKKPESPGDGASFEEIEEILYGEVRIDPFKIGYLTLDEISKILQGYYRREEREMKRAWEIARWQVMHFVAPYSKKKMMSVTDITVFPWEKGEINIPKREDVLDTLEKWNRWDEKRK